MSFRGIAPGETFVYRIPVKQSGTYWYHSHSGVQEQTGLLGALLIEPQGKDPIESDRDYVVLLTDWTDENPDTVFDNLKKQGDYYNYHRRTARTFFSDATKKGLRATVSNRLMWGRMNMTPTDIADVTSATYTYLVNGAPPSANWTALFEPGQRVRLRFINGSSMTLFDVRIPGLEMTVVQADGNAVEPVKVEEFRMGVAETYDVIVEPDSGSAYTIFAQPMSRYGYARATLAPKMGMSAPIPPMDPRPMRTMMDMGMGGMAGMTGMAGMNGMGGMHSAMAPMKPSDPAVATNRNHTPAEPFPQPGPRTTRFMPEPGADPAHPVIESHTPRIGPSNAIVAKHTMPMLNDPGDGLNGNGRRVLTYADLRARYPGVDGRRPSRQIELHLSGNMERFNWGFDGYRFSQAEPVYLKLSERVRIVLINDTMMEHPIHLHGLWSELENGPNEFLPFKHTLIVKPAERVSFLVSADTPGHWAFHCHLLYHMEGRHVSHGHRVVIWRLLSSFIASGALTAFAQSAGQSWPPPVRDNEIRYFVQFTQLEGRVIGPPPTFRWDGEGWIGTNDNRLWIKSEGDVTSGRVSDGQHEALYGRPISRLRYFDWQAGVRVDGDSGPTRTWGAVGIQGLAPYFFEIEPTFYFRDGAVAGRFEGLYNLYITQRLILQPQIELNFFGTRDPGRGIGTGLSNLDGGVRLGYQISRKFAPYVGFTYTGTYGETAIFAQRGGQLTHAARLAFGIWVWR